MKPRSRFRLTQKQIRLLKGIVLFCIIIILVITVNIGVTQWPILQTASRQPVEAFLVLGGSITREIYVSEISKQYPKIPILISTGSDDPCILKLFERVNAPIENVWLEKCANSTFDNFVYTQPILTQWGVHHVQMITSPSHLPRAKWMGQIILGAHGIWVDIKLVKEKGVPANREIFIKTGLDTLRAFGWALMSQWVQPSCSKLDQLSDVNLKQWCKDGFSCEYQSKLKEKQICESVK